MLNSCQKRHDGNTDATDQADKNGFFSACGVMGQHYISHELREFSRIQAQTSFARKRINMNEVNV